MFFIPYAIMLFVVGMPIFFLELSLGQFTSSGPLTCWEMAPAFKGTLMTSSCTCMLAGPVLSRSSCTPSCISASSVMVAYRSKRARLHLATCCDVIALLLGIGVAMVTVSALVGIYYNMIIAWAIYYLFASFTSKLPWEECHKDWASECKFYNW